MRTFAQGLGSEILVELRVYLQNKAAVVSDFLSYFLLYAFLTLFKTGTSLPGAYGAPQEYGPLLLFMGYILWMLCSRALVSVSSQILSEADRGFLFVKLTSVFPVQLLYFARLVTAVFIILLFVVPMFVVLSLVSTVPVLSALQIIRAASVGLIGLCGMYGIGLLLASLTMANKRLSNLSMLFSTVLLLTSNALTYSEDIHNVLAWFPANYCIHNVRMIVSAKDFFPQDFVLMASLCAALVAAGAIVFEFSIRKARKAGNILWY